MAAPAENLLSHGYQTGTKENTFTKQREQCVKRRAMQLQQRLQELKDRERQAQRHNKQLLQQFEEAQDALEEMLARNAAMKTIRMEYERYLEENSPRWQQQLQEKTQDAQKKRMGECLRSYLEKTDEKEVLTSTVDGPSLSQGPQKCVAPQENSDYNQNSSSHHPFSQSSWLTSTQKHTGRFPGFLTAHHQSHSPFLFPLPSPLHPHSFLLQHLTSSPGQCQPWSGQDAAGWDSSQHNNPRHWTTAIPSGSLGQLHPALRGSQAVGEEDETSRSPNSNRKDGGSGSCLSPDLDVKPVRLFSSESGRDSSLACMEKRKKRGRTQHPSSDSERSDSQKSSRTSSKIVASFTPAQNSERSSSSEESSTRSSRKTKRGGGGGFSVGASQPEAGAKETRRKEDKESQDTDEKEGSLSGKVENQSHGDKSKSCGAEEQGKSIKTQSRAEEETDVQEGSSSEQSCIEAKDEEDVLETGDEEENSQKSEKQISDLVEDDDVSTRKKTSEEEEEETADQGDEEQINYLKNKDTEIKKEDSASSQDEDEDGSESSEDKTNEEEEGSNKEEDSSEEEEESGDSEDIIISPQEKRSKQMLVIPEEAAEDDDDESEDDDESKTQSSNETSDDDIENLLAPLEQTKKEQRDVKADGEPKAVCQNMNMFQVTEVKSKTNHQSDSDEFDHFYD